MGISERLPPDTAEPGDAERHANYLELFLDLVFVFAVTQLASLASHDTTAAGVGRAFLIAALVWWQWSQYTWAGSAVDLQRGPVTRVLVLCTVPATLTMAVAIPEAFHGTGRWFGIAYLVVQLLVLGMQGAEALRHESSRGAFVKYASVASIAPVAVVVGAFLSGNARVGVWVVAVVLNVTGAMRAAAGEWSINPGHFAERHALFVIISLGEALVAIGAAATESGLNGRILAGLVTASALACVLWWTYFAYIPNVIEDELRRSLGPQRGRRARDLFTFGHFPIVAGIVLFAVVMKHMVPHPTTTLPAADRVLLAIAIALVVGGYLHMQWRIAHHLARERLVAVAIVAGWCAIAGEVAGVAVVAAVAVIVAGMQAVTWRRFRRGSLAHITTNR